MDLAFTMVRHFTQPHMDLLMADLDAELARRDPMVRSWTPQVMSDNSELQTESDVGPPVESAVLRYPR